MGLDMYLLKETYVGANYAHNDVTGKIELKRGDKKIEVTLKRVTSIVEQIGYWRKANAIHKWFVDNCQEGVDDCKRYYVERDKLKQLLELCQKAKKEKGKAKEVLPPTSGFFFGSTNVDEGYWDDIESTIKILKEALKEENGDFYYRSSW